MWVFYLLIIAGFVAAAVFRKRYPKVIVLVAIGSGLVLISLLANILLSYYVKSYIASDGKFSEISSLLLLVHTLLNVCLAAGMGFWLAAAFKYRQPASGRPAGMAPHTPQSRWVPPPPPKR